MRRRLVGRRLVLFVPLALGVYTSAAFQRNWSVASVLESAT